MFFASYVCARGEVIGCVRLLVFVILIWNRSSRVVIMCNRESIRTTLLKIVTRCLLWGCLFGVEDEAVHFLKNVKHVVCQKRVLIVVTWCELEPCIVLLCLSHLFITHTHNYNHTITYTYHTHHIHTPHPSTHHT